MKIQEKPWHRVQLSKAVRKGRTPKEIQQLRKTKWEQQCKQRKEILPGEILGYNLREKL